MKLKVFYYTLYAFVMIALLIGVLNLLSSLSHQNVLPSCFYNISTWFAYDELRTPTRSVQGTIVNIEDGFYHPQGNIVYSVCNGIVLENDDKLVILSDQGVKVVYRFYSDVKVGERIRKNDILGTSNQTIPIAFFIQNQEVDYEVAMQY